jgi:hypothetical protein
MAHDGLNPVNKDEREDTEPVKDEQKSIAKGWYNKPATVQTILIFGIGLLYVFGNYQAISVGITQWIIGVTGVQLVTLFTTTFVSTLLLGAYFFLVTYMTGNITNKILYAKLLKKRLMFYRGEDNIFHFYVPKTKTGFWSVEGVGEFKVLKDAMGWLENGVLMMPTVFGFAEGIDYNVIKDNQIMLVDAKAFEDRNKATRLEALEDMNKVFNPQVISWLIMGLLVAGIAGYLLINATQNSTCQSKLIEMAGICGEAGKVVAQQANSTSGFSFAGVSLPQGLPNTPPGLPMMK